MVDGIANQAESVTGWSWKLPNTSQKLVDPGSELVFDIRSDGTTLAWVQTTAKWIDEIAPGWLWTSPHTTEPAAVVATKRREVPAIGASETGKGIGGDYYALVDQSGGKEEQYVHVYRLSDARHWKVPSPADVRAADIILIDAEEVWILGITPKGAPSTIIRQRLDALGPGD